jgi:hypothetical protein
VKSSWVPHLHDTLTKVTCIPTSEPVPAARTVHDARGTRARAPPLREDLEGLVKGTAAVRAAISLSVYDVFYCIATARARADLCFWIKSLSFLLDFCVLA